MPLPAELRTARVWPKGRFVEDFEPGQEIEHHWGRTLTEADNTAFVAATLSYHPRFLNADYVDRVHDGVQHAHPMLVFCTVLGLTVEDLSEKGGAFLGVDDLVFHRPVSLGETLQVRSEVLDVRGSRSRPDHGIVRWRSTGYVVTTSEQQPVISYERANLIPRRTTAEVSADA